MDDRFSFPKLSNVYELNDGYNIFLNNKVPFNLCDDWV